MGQISKEFKEGLLSWTWTSTTHLMFLPCPCLSHVTFRTDIIKTKPKTHSEQRRGTALEEPYSAASPCSLLAMVSPKSWWKSGIFPMHFLPPDTALPRGLREGAERVVPLCSPFCTALLSAPVPTSTRTLFPSTSAGRLSPPTRSRVSQTLSETASASGQFGQNHPKSH